MLIHALFIYIILFVLRLQQTLQENHHLKMTLEVSQKSQMSQVQEIELLKEHLQILETEKESFKSQDDEQHRKEAFYESQVSSTILHQTIM